VNLRRPPPEFRESLPAEMKLLPHFMLFRMHVEIGVAFPTEGVAVFGVEPDRMIPSRKEMGAVKQLLRPFEITAAAPAGPLRQSAHREREFPIERSKIHQSTPRKTAVKCMTIINRTTVAAKIAGGAHSQNQRIQKLRRLGAVTQGRKATFFCLFIRKFEGNR